MKNNKTSGIVWFNRSFGTEKQCVKIIFEAGHSYKCSCGGTYAPLKGRRQYQCSKCRYQIAPTAGTIFHKSDTPLTSWFFAIFLFANAKSGYVAKQLERDLNVTYKTAWRMLTLIRKSLKQSERKLTGRVEMDETYMGGRGRAGRDNKDLGKVMREKSVIAGAVERGGILRAHVAPNGKAKTLGVFLKENIDPKATLLRTPVLAICE